MQQRKLLFIIGSICIILILIPLLIAGFKRSTSQTEPTTPAEVTTIPTIPAIIPTKSASPQSITNLARQQGSKYAIDPSSPVVIDSQAEIKKLLPLLPFTKDYILSTGITVSVVIPGSEQQDDPWKLTVQIFNINYQVLPSEPDYAQQKASFLEAVNNVFAWIRSQNADPQKIIFKWGDEAFIQNRAEEWLR